MPRGDRTGPAGFGPMTGRGLGYCAGYDTPGYTKGPGMGMGRGWGRGIGYGRGPGWRRGWGRGFGGYWGYGAPSYVPPIIASPAYVSPTTPETQLTMLKQEKDYLESEMEGIKGALADISKRIDELEKTE
ncbi:MAG: DUF5320 domain-containing protein [Promethearchaeota archaeon]